MSTELQERDQVRRFITLIDQLYEAHAKVVCTAAKDPIALPLGGVASARNAGSIRTNRSYFGWFHVSEEERKTSVADEIFAWDRTVSRLMEAWNGDHRNHAFRSLSAVQFLGQYKLKSLSDQEAWQGGTRHISWAHQLPFDAHCQEFRYLLEDLLERQCGHRNLSDESLGVQGACIFSEV
eukprot:Skav212232  [mRNA]  locus=scaffold4279:94043:99942:+ [translate_table: standard]